MLTVAYMTCRTEPKFEWFAQSLFRQVEDAKSKGRTPEIELLYVSNDAPAFERELDSVRALGMYFTWEKPKPTIWQGEHRKTTQNEYFAAANARNTAIIAAHGDYIVFVDDLSVLMPGWLENVMHAAQEKYCACGAYRKVNNMVVENGILTSFDDYPGGRDSRWSTGSASGIVRCGGGHLFGCSFGAPIGYLEEINGLDERCDSLGSEDSILGICLERAGCRLFYNRNVMTYEDEGLHHGGHQRYQRVDKKTPGNPLGHDTSHVVLNSYLRHPELCVSPNHFNIREARHHYHATREMPPCDPTSVHWVDGQPLEEM